MNSQVLRYILDIQAVIGEMESLYDHLGRSYLSFEKDAIAVRALERHFEIIGEAVNKLHRTDRNIRLEHAKSIIGLRNLIAHSYDSVDHGILWGILVNHVPKLKEEVNALKARS